MTPDHVAQALALFAADPSGLGGIWLRARVGPARDAVLASLASPLPKRRIHPGIDDTALYGGLDLTAALAEGRLAERSGLLSDPSCLVLTMAERADAALTGKLAQALDCGGHALIALDEAAEPGEGLAPALSDRLAFHLDLSDMGALELPKCDVTAIRPVTAPPNATERLVATALALGIDGLRPPLLALRAAKAAAHVDGRDEVIEADLALAAQLVLAPRATQLPAEDAPEDRAEPERDETETTSGKREDDVPEDLVLAAALAALPPDLLSQLAMGRTRQAAGAGSGAARHGNRRGRPKPARRGRPEAGKRLDLIATLRAAAPWQPLRRKAMPDRFLHIRPDDFRLRRFEEKSDRLLIFAVDASGSAALARLAETKGAIELLLAEAYARRDHVALIAFRGAEAELLLPPTRSLVQTKRRLSALPGGGGTPLADGLRLTGDVAAQARGRGFTPSLVLLTDGAANIALDGHADRAAAAADATRVAGVLAATGLAALVLDTGNRPRPPLAALASHLGATYLPMPRAEAKRVALAVSESLS